MRITFESNQAFKETLQLLEGAKKSIWISIYMLRFDGYTRQIWHILEKKHEEGIEVNVLYDAIGSLRSWPKLFASPFTKMYVPKWYRLTTRNHSKCILVDEEKAIVSGRNFTEKYFEHWVDTSTLITEKPLIEDIKKFRQLLMQKEVKDLRMDGPIRYTDPLTRTKSIYNFILESIATSKKKIQIMTPYFVLDDATENLLRAAADRGVKILIIVPHKPEHKLSKTFNRINFQRIHHKNVTVKRSKGMFHSKVMVFDDHALVGSANFDNRSWKYNAELSVRVDKEHMEQVEKHIQEVAHASVKYHWMQRAYDSVLYHLTRHLMEFL